MKMETIDLSLNHSNIEVSFERIANEFMNQWILQSNTGEYRIAEIEFYINDLKDHKDTYTHGHTLQKTSGKWYVHGSGIDITCGGKNYFGGILIRAICNLHLGKEGYIYGPINCLARQCEKYTNDDIKSIWG